MAETLSQSQIDELLNRARTDNVDEVIEDAKPKIKEYDFSSPKKFTKDQLKSLNNLYENFARVLSSYYTSILRSPCEFTILQIEEQRYYEFNNALPDHTLVGLVSLQPEIDDIDISTWLIQLPTAFGYLIIDRLMGGGEPLYAPPRDYTDIELSLLHHVMERTTNYMKEAWSNLFASQTALLGLETNGRLLQAYSPQDTVVIVTLEIKNDDYPGMANICMPAEHMESIISSFGVKHMHTVKQPDPERDRMKRHTMLNYIKQSELEAEVILDQCEMSLYDIATLQKDDILELNKKIDSNIVVHIENIPWFFARLGEVEDKKAIKLVDIYEK